jgi:ABC-type glycerol-3-phosphate transport system substrate-binding protein
MPRSVIFIAVVMTVTACGSDATSDTTSHPRDETTSTFREASTTTAQSVTTTSSPAFTTTTGLDIDVEIAGGEAQGPDSFEVTLGETVDVWILSDVDDEIHVHGYDLRFDLAAGSPFNLRFEADVPGIFEVETHGLQAPLFEIEVTG